MDEVIEKKITCIVCPMGCEITVKLRGDEIIEVSGARCPRGRDYAIEEVRDPKRIVMSVVKCVNGDLPTVSVKTSRPVPKRAIWDVMKLLAQIEVEAPVEVGQVIVENVLGLGVDIVATRPCRKTR